MLTYDTYIILKGDIHQFFSCNSIVMTHINFFLQLWKVFVQFYCIKLGTLETQSTVCLQSLNKWLNIIHFYFSQKQRKTGRKKYDFNTTDKRELHRGRLSERNQQRRDDVYPSAFSKSRTAHRLQTTNASLSFNYFKCSPRRQLHAGESSNRQHPGNKRKAERNPSWQLWYWRARRKLQHCGAIKLLELSRPLQLQEEVSYGYIEQLHQITVRLLDKYLCNVYF